MNFKSMWYQFIKLLPVLSLAYILTAVLLGVLLIINLITDIPFSDFTRDPVTIMGAPIYCGLLSNIGVLLWCSSATICLFSLVLLRRRSSSRELRLLILYLGLITLLLLLDDFFLLHETVGRYLADTLGVDSDFGEATVVSVYGVLSIWLIIRFKMVILDTEFVLLGFAFSFFFLSAIIDIGIQLVPFEFPHQTVEDIFKLFGIVSWFTYAVRTVLILVSPSCSNEVGEL